MVAENVDGETPHPSAGPHRVFRVAHAVARSSLSISVSFSIPSFRDTTRPPRGVARQPYRLPPPRLVERRLDHGRGVPLGPRRPAPNPQSLRCVGFVDRVVDEDAHACDADPAGEDGGELVGRLTVRLPRGGEVAVADAIDSAARAGGGCRPDGEGAFGG